MSGRTALTAEEREQSLANLKLERDAIVLYDRLSGIEKDERRAAAFRVIASNERRHAAVWADRLRTDGATIPPDAPPRARVRLIIGLARLFGTRAVSDLVKSLEGDEGDIYEAQEDPAVASIMADEREHAEIWGRLDAGLPPIRESATRKAAASLAGDATAAAASPATAASPAGEGNVAVATPGVATPATASPAASRAAAESQRTAEGRTESWHRAGRTGTLRAAIFGVNDGLDSNLALVMGVAGATSDNHFIVLAGVAGLLAGSFSMAAGEYVSMKSQRELFERQISLEREEMKIMPEAEELELAAIYRGKGLSSTEAAMVAKRLMADPEAALDTKIREELGLDPDELGSAWGAASYSLISFAIGAFLPLAPFLLTSGSTALVASVATAFTALFVVGAGVSLLTGRGLIFGGLRQVVIGAAAAGVTFVVGRLIGVAVG